MLTVFGIPTCGTVKKAQGWLAERNLPFTSVDFRATPPSRAQLDRWVATFGAKALRNTSGGSFRALPADKDGWDDATWTEAFAADAMLIKRPVIERDGVPVLVGFRGSDEELADRLG